MPKTSDYGVPDEENPEWTKEDFQRARRLKDIPELRGLYEQLQAEKQQAAKPARVIALKLPADVADAMQESGPGWQERAEDALRSAFRKQA